MNRCRLNGIDGDRNAILNRDEFQEADDGIFQTLYASFDAVEQAWRSLRLRNLLAGRLIIHLSTDSAGDPLFEVHLFQSEAVGLFNLFL